MPHLSPIMWLFIPLMMVFILLTMSIIIWFLNIPSFPSFKHSSTPMYPSWSWL